MNSFSQTSYSLPHSTEDIIQIKSSLFEPFKNLLESTVSRCYIKTAPYILSNENGISAVLQKLESEPKRKAGIHFGFSCCFNFDIISIRNSELAIIGDINKNTLLALDLVREKILKIEKRTDFLIEFTQELKKKEDDFFSGEFSLSEELAQEITRSFSWLSSNESYEIIRQKYSQNKILHYCIDVTQDEAYWNRIGQWLQEQSLFIDTLYISNISEWLNEPEILAMQNNLAKIIDKSTCVIYSKEDKSSYEGTLELRSIQGNLPSFSNEQQPSSFISNFFLDVDG